MSEKATPGPTDVGRLVEFQAGFIDRFCQPGSERLHLLISPPGAGKHFTTVYLISRLFTSKSARRALVLCPAALVSAWHRNLADRMGPDSVTAVDRQFFLELQSRAASGESIWPETTAVISMDTAKRDDVASALCDTTWDLVVVDEAHQVAGQRRELVERLVHGSAAGRLLLLTAATRKTWWADLGTPVAVTDWTEDLRRWQRLLNTRKVAVEFRVIEYMRTADEVAFLQALDSFLKEMPQTQVGRLVGHTVLRSASSCLFNMEQTLLHIRSGLEAAEGPELLPEEDGESPKAGSSGDLWRQVPDCRSKVDGLLQHLESVVGDAKVVALQSLLAQVLGGAEDKRVCIISSYANTVRYLSTALQKLEGHLFAVTGDTSAQQRMKALRRFQECGHVLLATDASLQGTELSFVDTVVDYDLPYTRERMAQRRGRFARIGRTKSLTMYALMDRSGALPFERQLLQKRKQAPPR